VFSFLPSKYVQASECIVYTELKKVRSVFSRRNDLFCPQYEYLDVPGEETMPPVVTPKTTDLLGDALVQ
jgi:hypothetical protein